MVIVISINVCCITTVWKSIVKCFAQMLTANLNKHRLVDLSYNSFISSKRFCIFEEKRILAFIKKCLNILVRLLQLYAELPARARV